MAVLRRVLVTSVAIVVSLMALEANPMVQNWVGEQASTLQTPIEIPAAFTDLGRFVRDLMSNTDDRNDSDLDGLYDSVELVIGTDPSNPDSDFDRLSDYYEAFNGMDPNKADSNSDRFPDYHEVDGVPLDFDGDGLPNVWDPDNDDDGVPDYLDSSPFAKTALKSSLQVDFTTRGKPTYVSFELRTKNPDHMRLTQQSWNWPTDSEGNFRDLDGSVDDVYVIPSLKIECPNLPAQEDVIDYGIIVDGQSALVPLTPVGDYGEIVALKGRMFFPSPAGVSLQASMTWRVVGMCDDPVVALNVKDGLNLSVQPDGSVLANGDSPGVTETFAWKYLGGNKVALRAANGLYLTLQPDGRISAASETITPESVFRYSHRQWWNYTFVASNGNYLYVLSNGTLTTVDESAGVFTQFGRSELGYVPSPTLLATYNEDFTLTGLNVVENFGTDVGVFHGTNSNEIIAANQLLADHFLRDSSCSMNDIDIPGLLAGHNLAGVMFDIQSFPHQDLGLVVAVSSMIPSAVESIPESSTLPIIVGIQESNAVADLSDASDATGNAISLDLANEPVVVSKLLRSSWYQGGNNTALEFFQVIDEVRKWGLDESTFQTTVGLIALWYCGECAEVSVDGIPIQDYSFPEAEAADMLAREIVGYCMDVIEEVMSMVRAFTECAATAAAWGTIDKAMVIVSAILEVGLAAYSLYAVGEELGWGAVGTGIAVTNAVVKLAYNLVLIVLSSCVPFGAIISSALIVLDYFLKMFDIDWVSEFVEWICELCSDARQRSRPSLVGPIESSLSIDDLDNNGVDVGDCITFLSRAYGNVVLTQYGTNHDLVDSFMCPHQVADAPQNSNSVQGVWTAGLATTWGSSGDSKSTYWQTEAWVYPGTAMPNFPIVVGLYSDFRAYYETCWWAFGWHCDRKEQSGSIDGGYNTVFFDIMPGSLDEFCSWKSITSNDYDGDGVNNSEEWRSGGSEYCWDSDGDGLGDNYEIVIGTDPRRSDSDRDGLNDKFEHQRGFNCSNADTDSDGLDDFFELRGWTIDIAYRGQTYYWLVSSEPNIADTDGDGVNDSAEYYLLLNPRSRDSDGNGEPDELTDYYITRIEYETSTSEMNYRLTTMAVDDDGFAYVSGYQGGVLASYHVGAMVNAYTYYPVMVYDENLTPVGAFGNEIWCLPDDLDCVTTIDYVNKQPVTLIFVVENRITPSILIYAKYPESQDITLWSNLTLGQISHHSSIPGDRIVDIAVDPRGPTNDTYLMYVTDTNHVHPLTMKTGAELSYHYSWDMSGLIDVDQDGYVYIYDLMNCRVRKFVVDPAYYYHGTLVTEWGNESDFQSLYSIAVDADGNILTLDAPGGNERIQKWSPEGRRMGVYSSPLWVDRAATDFDVDLRNNNIYVSEYRYDGYVSRYSNSLEQVQQVPDYTFEDADSDGLTDKQETAGWDIIVSDVSGASASDVAASFAEARRLHVASDPLAPDTDFDGVSDPEEFRLLSDPRAFDSDNDGLSDGEEVELGTNLTSADTDGEGLGDGLEVGFGSDPKSQDSDDEGLSDYQEFVIGSDPTNNDTDHDGLNDQFEIGYGADPKNPDPDGDFMFDGQEFALGANPNSQDTDSDGIEDGYEVLYGTSPTLGDSDGDSISDGFEVSSHMDPLSDDTDGDGVSDSTELERGLNPLSRDSDGDGVPDSVDQDYLLELDGEIVLCYDDSSDAEEFAVNLSKQASVRVVGPDELLQSQKGSRYVVLVGDPEGANGTAGGIIGDLLQNSGDVRQRMKESDYDRIAVRYGAWNSTQTIVMLSNAHESDCIRVIGMLKSMRMTLSEEGVLAEYMNPRSCFLLDQEDVIKTTDTYVWSKLDNMTTFKVNVERLTDDQMTTSLADSGALSPDETAMDKYVRIEFQPTGSGTTATVLGSVVQIYYTIADLDLNGDGDAVDREDLNESSLSLFVMSGDGTWIRLSDIVNATGVNTTDVVMFGKQYAGYVWANVSGLSLFGIAASTNGELSEPLGISWLLVALIALAAVVVIAVAIVILWTRRKRGPPLDEGPGSVARGKSS